MIENETQLRQARKALGLMEGAMADLKRRYVTSDPELFKMMSAAPRKNIERIRKEIDEYIGVPISVEEEAPFWLRLIGKTIKFGETSAMLISNWIEKVVEAYCDALRETHGAIKIPDLQIAAVRDGSFGVGFKLPESQLDLFEEKNYPEETLSKLSLAAICLTSDNPEKEFETSFPDVKERKIFLEYASKLIPSQKSSVERVELSGSLVPQTETGLKAHLIPDHKKIATVILESIIRSEVVEEEKEVVRRGWLYRVNYDNGHFKLKGVVELFNFTPDLAKKVKDALDPDKQQPQQAEVIGVLKDGVIRVLTIKRLEE